MKKNILFIFAFIMMIFNLNGQTILFQENFETTPITSVLNNFEPGSQLEEGPSECGRASRGNTADFNSANVDFNEQQNSSYFLAANPEAPCGGFYDADLSTGLLDFSTANDTINFKCKYFISSTLNWGEGGNVLEIIFDNGTLSHTIDNEFSTLDNWDSIEVKLPLFAISENVTMAIHMEVGEGIAIDDIVIDYGSSTTTAVSTFSSNFISIYPNPSQDFIYLDNSSKNKIESVKVSSLNGQVLSSIDLSNTQSRIDVSNFDRGIYILTFNIEGNMIETYRFVKL